MPCRREGNAPSKRSNVILDEEYVCQKKAAIPKGRYAALTVSDTGAGISADHLPHIFDPFYTTKPSGKGTGLGLATVYGIVKQNHGFVWAYSEAGNGHGFQDLLARACRIGCGHRSGDTEAEAVARGHRDCSSS